MSPSWRERIVIGLAPDAVSALRFARGWRPALVRQTSLACESGMPAWQPAVAALRRLLAQEEWRGGELHLVLSNHFVRYAVVPGNAGLRTPEERDAYAAIALEKTYGSLCAEWELRASPAAGDEPTLASGVERALLAAIAAACPATVKLKSIRPYLMCAFNRMHGDAGDSGTVALALIESGRVTLGLARQGRWADVASRAVAATDGATLERLLAEQCAAAGVAPRGALWLHDAGGAVHAAPGASWSVRTLDLAAPAQAAGGLAWCGAA